ncbi:OLC1v1014286C1 [Oldenlandia corymbosa var. corymbosa]|uniref:OLC1v1014286C1 n=1 Tax=Oldenlandia corymbosa var. corymbosa TaxID=529605 RepID=A0AAV1E2V7_OLDCO|nr:OLC1v1014286C1 [Oldenlandia corymbosa var. corymbosa]
MSQTYFIIFLFLSIYLSTLHALPQLSDPDPAPINTQPLLPNRSPPATIPAFPEESNVDGCPLDLPDDFFSGIKSACGSGSKHHSLDPDSYSGRLHKTRCCPVLGAWLYAAYSKTALQRAITGGKPASTTPSSSSSSSAAREVDMPLLPDDSETCVDSVEKALVNKGVNLVKPNQTCDIVYCYCGIRLHPLSCPESFYVNSRGKLAGGDAVKKLEKDCSGANSPNGYAGLNGCSKCLNSLFLLNGYKAGNTSKLEERTTKMRSKDCELMGLTWLLHKNRTAYIHTVSSVLRALMSSTEGTYPQSCTLNSDGKPLAVDSSEINDESSSPILQFSLYLLLLLSLFSITLVI